MADPIRNAPGTVALVQATISALQDAKAQTDTAMAAAIALSNALEQAVQLPLNVVQARAEHRRHLRRGTSSKVQSDPGLRAVIFVRLATMTFKQIALAVAATFRQTAARSCLRSTASRHVAEPNGCAPTARHRLSPARASLVQFEPYPAAAK